MSILVFIVIIGICSVGALSTTVITLLRERRQREESDLRESSEKAGVARTAIGAMAHEKTLGISRGGGGAYIAEQAIDTGPETQAISFSDAWRRASSKVKLAALAAELGTLRAAMRESGNEPQHDLMISEIANAQLAASSGDGPLAMSYLSRAGRWALSIAISIGARSAAAAIEIAIEPGATMTTEAVISAGTKPQARPRLTLALAVIATAQLMVVLDATIVNVALPHIQDALHFSGANLEWVVNAYALAFGGLLLLGGRSGDLLGRRQVFTAGILLFSVASVVGGLATSQAWLVTGRVLQGVGAAFAAPTALSLIAVTFPEGMLRNRAMGVYAAMSVAGGAVGLIAGGLLVQYASWRWVFFVNVPIGLAVAALAPRVLSESERRRGQFDLPGAITGSLGLASLVYGLSNVATSPNGVSHWGDTKVIVSLVAAVVLLVAFGIIEVRGRFALVPIRVLRSRDRTGAYLISLCIGTVLFGIFFFLTLFVQNVWGYSALKTGISYLPMVAMIMVASGAASQLINPADRPPLIGTRPLIITGSVLATGGLIWLSRVTEHSTYTGGLLGPMMLTGAGMGLLFVPITLVSLTQVANNDAGVASGLLNVGQQVGGALGLAILGTVAWSAVNNSLGSAARTGPATYHALAHGFSQAYLVAAGIMLLGLVIALVAIRVTREDLSGVNPMAAPDTGAATSALGFGQTETSPRP